MDDFVKIISNLGFPIAITFYLLTRFEKKIDRLSEAVDRLEKTLQDLNIQLKIKK